MLTKSDLSAIQKIVDTSIESKTRVIVQEELTPIKKDLKSIKRRIRRTYKTVDVLIGRSDLADVTLDRRVTKIEKHLGFPPSAA